MNPLLCSVQTEKEQVCNTSVPVNLTIISRLQSIQLQSVIFKYNTIDLHPRITTISKKFSDYS